MNEPSNHHALTTRIILAVATLALTFSLVACGGATPAPEKSQSFGGDWQGNWASIRGAGGSVAATFEQNGTKLTGEVTLSGSPCLNRGAIDGSVSGSGATFGALSGPDQIMFTGNKEGEDRFSGTYSVNAGRCIGDTGTFAVVRTR